jgi:PIN domain nuclease of toxin-antitoxin system
VTYLLDTNTVIRAMVAPRKLSQRARRICESPALERAVSVVSLWEIVTKNSLGKLEIPGIQVTLNSWPSDLGARVLAIERSHVEALYALPLLHKDPFDCMIVAQAVAEGFTLVTSDETLHRYPVKWVW